MHTVILLDARNCAFRHGWTRKELRTIDGVPTGAIFGVLASLIRLNKYYPDAHYVFCWDGDETFKSWRHKLSPDYKANRRKPSAGDAPQEVKDIIRQIPKIKEVLSILGFKQFEVKYTEGDDVVGILAKALEKFDDVHRVLIYSMDKDYFGLISNKIRVLRDLDKSDNCKAYGIKGVKADFGIHPRQWFKYRALIGDKSDNIIPAIPKVGPKTAIKLLAAGLDPNMKKPAKYLDKDYSAQWPRVTMNYQISKIQIDASNPLLPASVRKEFKKILKQLVFGVKAVSRKFTPDRKTAYKQFISFCADHELNWIIEKRDVFFTLGMK